MWGVRYTNLKVLYVFLSAGDFCFSFNASFICNLEIELNLNTVTKIWLVFELYFSILSPFPALFTVKICSYWAEPFIYPWFLVLWLLWPFCFCSYLLSLCVLKEKNSYIKSNHIAVELNTMSLTQGRGRLWKDLWK